MLSLFVVLGLHLTAGAAQYEERENIRVGFFAFDGYHMIDEEGNCSGYGYDFLQLAARYIDVDYEYIGYDEGWAEMLHMLRDGRVDMVTSAQETAERLKEFAFSKPIGSSSAMLTVSNDNTSIIAGNYATYDGMKVGILEENSRNEDLENYAQECGFSYETVSFEEFGALEQALQSGQIDAALTSSLRKTNRERIIDQFASSDFYVIVRKEDTALLDKINYAIDQLNAVEGDWQNDLRNLYYDYQDVRELAFTPEEQQLIRQYTDAEKSLVVSVCTDKKPYAYVENGEAKGILLDYFAELAEYVGVPYTVVAPSDREEYTQWCEEENVANVFLDGRFASIQQAEERGKAVTAPYTTMHLAMLTRRDFDGRIHTLAVSEAQGLFGIEDGLAADAERLMLESREEAMQAVLDGRADAAFVYLYTAQQFVNQDESGLLTYTMLTEPTYEYQIAFASGENRALAGIFTKAIYAMPSETFENIASAYTSYKAEDINLLTWIKIHPLPTLAIGMGVFVIGLLAVLVLERQKAVKLEQQRSAQLQELAALADSSNRAKTLFLNNMSHDIRTPMNAIIGFTALAASHLDNPQRVKEYLQKISVSSEHLLSLINDVLDMSRIESGRMKIEEKPLYFPDFMHDICTIMQPTIASKQLDFVIDTSDVRDENIIADKLRLNQILLNILSNSVKFNKVGGMVSLRVRQLKKAPAGYASYQFMIRDTGIGMKPEFVNHIFDAFAREETTTISGIPGTGLGMTITQNIVDMMGGSIRVESQEGVGTEFTVTLTFRLSGEPVSYEKIEQLQGLRVLVADDDTDTCLSGSELRDVLSSPFQKEKPEEEQTADFTGKTILLVEDNQLNQEIASSLLEEMGAKIDIADDGTVAVEKMKRAQHGQYDLILMDIQMPVMDGYEATRTIRALPDRVLAATPIVAMTANAFSSDQERAIASGMNGYLTKPINIKKMVEVLSEIFQKDDRN